MTELAAHGSEILWEDGELVLSRGTWDGEPFPLLAAMSSSTQPSPETLARLQHAYALRGHRHVNELGVGKRLNADHVDFQGPSVSPPSRPPEVISYAVWLYFRFPLSLRMVEEMLAAREICVTYETVRQWGKKFGRAFSDQIRQRAPARGDKWHMDEVVVSIAGEQHWLWRAVDQNGFVLDVLVQRRRDSRAAQRLMRKLLKSAVTPPRVMITDKLKSYGAARAKMGLRVDHRQHKGLTIARRIPTSRHGERTDHEAIQISPAGPTVSVGSRSSREPLPHSLS
jgi:transposase-like protein